MGGRTIGGRTFVQAKSLTRFVFCAAVTVACVASLSQAEDRPSIDKKLAFLEPFLAHDWTGGYIGEDAPDLEIVLHYEAMVEGKAVRYTRVAEDVNYNAEMFFFWDPADEVVLFLMFDNKGNLSKGTVEENDTGFVLHGKSHRPSRIVEYENAFEILADGRMRDTYTPLNLGPDEHGHVQEFAPAE